MPYPLAPHLFHTITINSATAGFAYGTRQPITTYTPITGVAAYVEPISEREAATLMGKYNNADFVAIMEDRTLKIGDKITITGAKAVVSFMVGWKFTVQGVERLRGHHLEAYMSKDGD